MSQPQGTERQLGAVERLIEERTASWKELSQALARGHFSGLSGADVSRAAELYREACTDHARARALGANPELQAYLDALVSRGHSALYADTGKNWPRLADLVWRAFPRALRKNWRMLLIASALFWIPFVVALSRSLISEEYTASIIPFSMMEQMADAYQESPDSGRSPGANTAMAGFYVYNNVGIAFRCFATGILFGLGSAFFLVYNGAVTGAVFGHVIRTGGGPNILTFVAGHAPLELTAIVISGAAGLRMGQAIIQTSGRTRLGSLWAARDEILPIVLGAALMLLLAAVVEGFWSPSSVPDVAKWISGAVLLLLVVLYLAFAGRRPRRSPAPPEPTP